MGKLIHFPTGKEIKSPKKTEEELIDEVVNELVEISQHLFDLIDECNFLQTILPITHIDKKCLLC